MPRPKRSSAPVQAEISAVEQQEMAIHPSDCLPSRPKRVRKQTQRYSNSATATATSSRHKAIQPKRTTSIKGKRRAQSTDRETNLTELRGGINEPPKKKARLKKESIPKDEKRLAQFRPHCPEKVLERAERVRTQRFFMIDRKREDHELKEEFKVLGSTANVYTVIIDHKPKCDCPDNRMGNHCKHIMFVFLKVLCVPIESHIWYQKALLTNELESVFAKAPEAPNSVTNPRVREAFLRATGQIAESSAATNNKRRIPGEEDDCPICYDTMYHVAEAALTFCEECGNALHKECFVQYEKSATQRGKTLTCVWCRSERGIKGNTKPATLKMQRGPFINLASTM